LVRRLFLLLGATATIAGAIWLHHARQVSVDCVPHTAGNPGFGVTSNCLNQVGVEYVSFGITMAGLFIIVLALLLMDRDRAAKYKPANRDNRHIGTPGQDPGLRPRNYAPATNRPEPPEDTSASSSGPSLDDPPVSPSPEP